MTQALFPVKEFPQFLLEIVFAGPSFDGMMEIVALQKEIEGLREVFDITARTLKRRGRLNVKLDDIEVFIEAFEKGSFRKRLKVFNKKTKEFIPLIELAGVIILIFQTIPQYLPQQVKPLSPELIASLHDQVALELLQDPKFLTATANIVGSISQEGDKGTFKAPDDQKVEIDATSSKKFLQLAGEPTLVEEGEKFEELKGYINRVDLDATRRHIGFKINGQGNSIPATLSETLRGSVDMRNLLGQWVETQGTTSIKFGLKDHVDIESLKVITQPKLDFSSTTEKE